MRPGPGHDPHDNDNPNSKCGIEQKTGLAGLRHGGMLSVMRARLLIAATVTAP
jgi:hypothetical protein